MNENVIVNTEVSDEKKNFLPVGSVVRLKDAKMNIIVIGYTPIEKNKTEIWDYLGAMWPMGVISSDRNLLFNRDQIETIVFEGFSNDEEKDFRAKLEKAVAEIKK